MSNEYKTILKKIRELKEPKQEYIASGGCKDFGEYQNVCGVITGLALVEREIIDLLNIMERNNERN